MLHDATLDGAAGTRICPDASTLTACDLSFSSLFLPEVDTAE